MPTPDEPEPTIGTAQQPGGSPDLPGAPEVLAEVPGTDVTAPGRRRRLLGLVVVLAVVVLVVDQLTKAWALHALADGLRRPVLGNLLGLELVFNPGAALSIATGMTWVLTIVAATVVVVVARVSRRLGSTGWALAFGLLLGGAVGNLVDRLVRAPGPARGHVVDFIAYGRLFVGNVADVAIVVAAGLVVLQTMRGVQLDGGRPAHGSSEASSRAAAGDPPR